MVATISAQALADLRRRGESLTLIDVRTPAEYGEVHVDCARNMPLDRLDPQSVVAEHGGRNAPIYFVCRSGGRSGQAISKLKAAGFTKVYHLQGGFQAWTSARKPVVRK